MKIRKFLIKKASRGEVLTKRAPEDLKKAIKSLTADDIKKIFRNFVPLDFVALVQHENPDQFEQALLSLIEQKLNRGKKKQWVRELEKLEGITVQDKEKGLSAGTEVVTDVYNYMLNDDPMRRGILSEIKIDGSRSDKFHFVGEENPELRAELKKLQKSDDNGLVVPYCPVDAILGIDFPLWSVDIGGNQFNLDSGVDNNGRCTNYEVIGEISPEQFQHLQQTGESLNEQQIEQIEDGLRTLEYESGYAILRCTFQAHLSRFQGFLDRKMDQAVKATLNTERQRVGKNIDPQKLNRHRILTDKLKMNHQLTTEEQQELRELEKYIAKKQKDLTPTSMSLNQTLEGKEGEGASLEEILVVEKDIEVDHDAGEKAAEILAEELPDEFRMLQTTASKIPLIMPFVRYQEYRLGLVGKTWISDLPDDHPIKLKKQDDFHKELEKVCLQYFGKDQKKENKCITCGTILGETSDVCTMAASMKGVVGPTYQASETFDQFKNMIKEINPHAMQHYIASNLDSLINKAFSGIEIEEDEVELDLGDFQSFDEEVTEDEIKPTLEELNLKIENSLDQKQKAAYYGTDVSHNLDIEPEDLSKINKLAEQIENLFSEFFDYELEEELKTFLLSYG